MFFLKKQLLVCGSSRWLQIPCCSCHCKIKPNCCPLESGLLLVTWRTKWMWQSSYEPKLAHKTPGSFSQDFLGCQFCRLWRTQSQHVQRPMRDAWPAASCTGHPSKEPVGWESPVCLVWLVQPAPDRNPWKSLPKNCLAEPSQFK